METVKQVNSLSRTLFNEDFFNKRPVVYKGAVKHTKCFQRWSPEYLKAVIGPRVVNVAHSQSGSYNITIKEKFQNTKVEFTKAVDMFTAANNAYYLFKSPVFEQFPELLEDLEIPPYVDTNFDKIAGINFWMGGTGCVTHLHYDTDHNFLVQIRGRKELILFAPEDTSYVYWNQENKGQHVSLVDPENPDLERFPLYKHATPVYCLLEPGDFLYLPPSWWHQVRSLEMCINVNFWYNRFDILDGMGSDDFGVEKLRQHIKMFVDKGFKVDHKDDKGEILLVKAVQKGYTNAVEAFLSLGANPNSKACTHRAGTSLLSLAMENSSSEIVRLLLKYGAIDDTVDSKKIQAVLAENTLVGQTEG